MEFKNQRYYSLCRYELDKKPSFIYEEVKDLFNHKAITISHIYTWSHQFRNERNEQKRGRLFEFDEFDKNSFENLKFELKSNESNNVKKIQFYALCRIQLNVKHLSVIKELSELFYVDAPDIVILNMWIKDFWKENDFNLMATDSNPNIDQLLYENSMLKDENHRLHSQIIDSINENNVTLNIQANKENLAVKLKIATLENNLSKMEGSLSEGKKNNEKTIKDLNDRILLLQIEKIKLKESNQIFELEYNQVNALLKQNQQELISKQIELDVLRKDCAALRTEKEISLFKQYEQFSQLEMRLNMSNSQINEYEKKHAHLDKLIESIMNKNSNLRLENEKAISLANQYIEKLKISEENLKCLETQLAESKKREKMLKIELDRYGCTQTNQTDPLSPIEFIDLTENVRFFLQFLYGLNY